MAFLKGNLYRYFADALEHTAVGPWYKRMEAEVGSASRTDGIEN